MNKDISNYDENYILHGLQIEYYANGNISWIHNFHHGKLNGCRASFYPDKSINYKDYWNMDKSVYEENHLWINQIQIKI